MDFGASGLSFECLLTRMEGSTLVLTLNRPDARNSINWTMEQELWEALAAAQRIDAVRAVVLNGAGEMFSAGHDLKQVAKEARDGGPEGRRGVVGSPDDDAPVVELHQAVHRGGTRLRRAVRERDPPDGGPRHRGPWDEVQLRALPHGVGRPWGPYALMYFMFPPRVIYKLWALGGWMDAEQAQQLHYVQRVVERDEVDAVALRWAEQCSLIDSEGFAHTKKGMHEMYEAMGLLEMVEIGRKPMEPPSAEAIAKSIEFNKTWKHEGAKAALALRDADVDPDFSQV